jgi:alanyl-tRNA synthetase
VRGSRDDVEDKIRALLDRSRKLEREVSQLKDKLAGGQGKDLAAGAENIKGVQVVATIVDGADAASLRNAIDQLKSRLKTAAIVLGSVDNEGKVVLIAGVTADTSNRIKAGDLVNHVAQQVGGRGGGRPDMAQAGGTDPAKLPAALQSVPAWVRERLA